MDKENLGLFVPIAHLLVSLTNRMNISIAEIKS